MEEEINYLKKIGFEDEDIEEIMLNIENEIDIKSLHEKIKYLISLGLDARQIRIVVEENSLFITEDLETILKNVCIILNYIDKEKLPECLEVTPDIITVPNDFLEKNLELIGKYVDKNDLKLLILDRGDIFTYIPDYLEKKINFIKNVNPDISIFNIIIEMQEIFDLKEDEIDIEELKDFN